MLILAGKSLLWFSYIFLCLLNIITVAQPDFLSYFCENAANFTRYSRYERNLDTTLFALPTTNSGFGFYNLSTGQGINRVNSIALCRGDINPDVCRTCLNDSIVKLRELCPNQKEAMGYYDNCLLRYSNETILGKTGSKIVFYLLNNRNSPDRERFSGALRPLLADLRAEAAAGGSLRKFATGNTSGPDFTTIYGLVQCTPDLSESQCSSCLEESINQYAIQYSMRIGGRAVLPMCNFRYEINRFFNESTPVIPPPPPPSPQASPPPVQPVPENTNKTRTVIIVIASVTIIASICIYMKMGKKKHQMAPTENTEKIDGDLLLPLNSHLDDNTSAHSPRAGVHADEETQ